MTKLHVTYEEWSDAIAAFTPSMPPHTVTVGEGRLDEVLSGLLDAEERRLSRRGSDSGSLVRVTLSNRSGDVVKEAEQYLG